MDDPDGDGRSGAPDGRVAGGRIAEDRWLLAGRHEPEGRSLPLELAARLLYRSILLLAVYLLLVGHYDTGGGFAGGLVAGAGFTLRYIAGGPRELRAVVPFDPGLLMGAGLLVALTTAVVPWFFGEPLLTSAYLSASLPLLGEVSFTTSVLFELGIFLLVAGVAAEVLRLLGVYGAPEIEAPEGLELR
ncbi:MAG TPA: MnhB domain-containing protein [Pseudonocardia sp.]|nr:MnhB domain-containing protein [Pseudonocardia sp.]